MTTSKDRDIRSTSRVYSVHSQAQPSLPLQRSVSNQAPPARLSRTSSVRVSFEGSFADSGRESKSIYSFMDKRGNYQIIFNGADVTPQNRSDSKHFIMDAQFAHAVFESRQRKSEAQLARASRSFADNVGMKVYATTISLDDLHIDYTVNTEAGLAQEACLDRAPSAFYLAMMRPVTAYPPEFSVSLKETETMFLFALPSFSCERGTPESVAVEQENEYYQYMTVGKGRNRKTICAETQTQELIVQTRHTLAKMPQKKNAIAFASVWDMHDTYALQRLSKEVPEEDEMVMYQAAAPNLLRKKVAQADAAAGEPFAKIATNPRFLDALVLVERVLANNVYNGQQKRFRGLVPFDPLALDLKYVYTLQPLWVFTCAEVAGLPVADACFNPANDDIIATAYGKFLYGEPSLGVVCVWSTKNPRKPERIYYFKEAASSISFSDDNPNWLACGFKDGDVHILDITSYEERIIAKSKRDTNPCFEPIWCVVWSTSEGSKQEYVMGTCQDGRINRYTNTKTHDFICTPMMRVTQVEGKVRGVYCIRPCLEYDVPIVRNPAALCYARHPSLDHVYYVGTDEGCVHKCSTNYLNQHMEVFRAHVGPVYDIQFSPYWSSLMLTCGADWAMRLWIEGIDDPILTMTCASAVYGASWSPINSTILVSVSGSLLYIWDIRRKSYVPSAEYKFPSGTILTYVHFGASGESLFVGDNMGQIHTFELRDMPIAPFYQKQILEESIRKVLSTRPHVARQLEKIEKFKSTQDGTQKR